jgi:hypothetical protein
MEALRHHYIEHEILRRVLEDRGDPDGLSVSVPDLRLFFRDWFPDLQDRELVDALKCLHPNHLTLHKWSKSQRCFVEYALGATDDNEFFHRDEFRARRTPFTDPYLQELATCFPEPLPPKRPIGFNP